MRPSGFRVADHDLEPLSSELSEGRPVAPHTLTPYTRRRLANRLAVAIKRKRWVPHRRALSAGPSASSARGTGFARPEPTTETTNRYIHSVVTEAYPVGTLVDGGGGTLDLSGRVFDAHALYTDTQGYGWFLQDLRNDGLLEAWQAYLHTPGNRAPFTPRQPDAVQKERRMVRNGAYVTEEAALAAERLPDYCVVWQLSARAIDAYCDVVEGGRAKRLPELVVTIIEAAVERPNLPRAA